MKKIFFSLFLVLNIYSFQSFADVMSNEEKEIIISELQNKITNQYVLTENIEMIQHTLSKLKASEKFKLIETRNELAKILATTIREFDGHFTVLWSDPTKEKTQKNDAGSKKSKKSGKSESIFSIKKHT